MFQGLEHVRLSQLKDSHSRLNGPCWRHLHGHEADDVPGPGHPNVYQFWSNKFLKERPQGRVEQSCGGGGPRCQDLKERQQGGQAKKDEGDSDAKMDMNHYNYVVDLLRVVLASSAVANDTLI